MSANKTRVQVRGSVGKSVRFPTAPGSTGATIGVDLKLPDGSIPSLQQLAAALNTGSALQDQPGNIVPPGGGSGSTLLLWQNVQYVPANILYPPRPIPQTVDPDPPRVIPGPAGRDGVIGHDGAPGLTVPRFADEPDRPRMIPGPPGAAGAPGGSSVAVSDGVTTVSAVTQINLTSGATVTSGGAGIADVAISGGGGGSGPFNVTPDTHGPIPTGVGVGLNDEFEGAALDTAGTRYAGATAWTWTNQNSATAVLSAGSVIMTCDPAATGDNNNILLQPIAASTWTVRMKYAISHGNSGNGSYGLVVHNSGNGLYLKFGVYNPSNYQPIVQQLNTPTSAGSNVLIGGITFPDLSNEMEWLYLEVSCDGTSLFYSWSLTGLTGSYVLLHSETLASWMGAVTDVGLCVNQNSASGATPVMLVDWFRQVA